MPLIHVLKRAKSPLMMHTSSLHVVSIDTRRNASEKGQI